MKLVTKQFFGKTTWWTLAGIVLFHVLAIFVKDTTWSVYAVGLAGILTLIASLIDLRFGLVIAFVETFVGGHGHLMDGQIAGFGLSLRMAVFAGVMLGWLIQMWRKKVHVSFVAVNGYMPWVLIVLAILWGTFRGFTGQSFGAAFDDMNVYLSIGYLLPILSIEWNAFKRKMLLQALAGSVIWIVAFTFGLEYVFTHYGSQIVGPVYTFVRDTRLAEITLRTVSNADGEVIYPWLVPLLGEDGYWYRVFMPAQFFVGLASLFYVSMVLFLWKGKKVFSEWYITGGLIFATMLLSESRSFAVGLLAGFGCMGLFYALKEKKRMKDWFVAGVRFGLMGAIGLLAIYFSVTPLFTKQPDIQSAAFYETSANTTRNMAVTSRWALLTPLMEEIWEAPIAGKGFGSMITYQSDDPRIIEETGGIYETYRFEWGYQDIWLKMGIAGLLGYVVYFFVLRSLLRKEAEKQAQRWIYVAFLGGLWMLFTTHVFSPYLNHSIGIMMMLYFIPFLPVDERISQLWNEQLSEMKTKKTVVTTPKTAPLPVVTQTSE